MSKKSIELIYPLSPSQQGMLLESLGAPCSGLHVEQGAWCVRGAFDPRVFERAWQRVVDRHEILRTGFSWKSQEKPLQVVLRTVRAPVATEDWGSLPPAEQEERLHRYLQDDVERGFDFSQPPLMRFAVFDLDGDQRYLVWTHHHILLDGWCRPLLLNELFSVYEALQDGREPQLTKPRPYRDYIRWLQEQDAGKAQDFWRRTLRGVRAPTPIGRPAEPGDGASAAGAQDRYQERLAELPEDRTARLKQLVQQQRVTLNTAVQGAWALLLGRYSGETKVVFGATVSGRPPDLVGIDRTIGLFINTLPIAVTLPRDGDLWSWLRDLQAFNLELRQFEYSSGELVREHGEIPASSPLYESILVFENFPPLAAGSAEVELATREVHQRGAQTTSALAMLVDPGPQLRVRIVYDRTRLEDAGIDHLVDHLLNLLARFADGDAVSLPELRERIPEEELPRFFPRTAGATAFEPPQTPEEERLAEIWREVLQVDRIGRNHNFFELGGSSLLATRVVDRMRRAGLPITVGELVRAPTIAELAARAGEAATIRAEQGLVVGRCRPLPGQLMFFELNPPHKHLATTGAVIEVSEPLAADTLKRALEALLRHHDTLRIRAFEDHGTWHLELGEMPRELPFQHVDLSGCAESELDCARSGLIDELQRGFDLARGPLFRAVLVDYGGKRPQQLLLFENYQVGDIQSWGIVLTDLRTAYEELRSGRPGELPSKTTSFREWGDRLAEYAQSPELERELGYWLNPARERVEPLPRDGAGGRATIASAGKVNGTLSREESEALEALVDRRALKPEDLSLTALALSFRRWTGAPSLLVDLVTHGRPALFADMDLSRTVGWFASTYPVLLDLGDVEDPEAALEKVSAQLRRIPQGGIGHGILRYLRKPDYVTQKLVAQPRPEISFNNISAPFAGEEGLFRVTGFLDGMYLDQQCPLPHLFAIITSFSEEGIFRLRLMYSREAHREETARSLVDGFLDSLRGFLS